MTYHAKGFSSIRKRARYIAAFFALNLLFEIVAPLKLLALTGGPSQPEATSFEPVGTTDMVDLFSGDFTYNIPLFDIGGYPVNISYHAGVSMDQEASWVGLGWNINPGAINRGMRGVPDDFSADDVKKKMHVKDQKTLALKFNTDLEIFGFFGRKGRNKKGTTKAGENNSSVQKNKMAQLSKFNLGFGVVYNNYKGIGYSLDLSGDISKTIGSVEKPSTTLLPGLDKAFNASGKDKSDAYKATNKAQKKYSKTLNTNLSLSASSQDGASLNANVSLSFTKKLDEEGQKFKSITPSVGLGYNSYLGASSFDVGISKSKGHMKGDEIKIDRSGGVSAYLPIGNYSYVPNIQMAMLSTSNSFNATIGFDAFGGHPNMRLSGFYNTESLETEETNLETYGYLYEHEVFNHRGADNILMDFNREKESSGNKNATHLPLANHTYDIYSVSGQGTGGMYRPHRKTIGVLHDKTTRNRNKTGGMNDLGIELGFGVNFRFGLSYKNKRQKSSTGLWSNSQDNDLINRLNYRTNMEGANPERYKQVYFKAAGEQTPSDNGLAAKWGGKDEVSLRIGKTGGSKRNQRFGRLYTTLNQRPGEEVDAYTTDNPARSNMISYLTAAECSNRGLGVDPYIISYPQDYWSTYIKNQDAPELQYSERYDGNNGAKSHHISEIISTGGDGMRYVYGLPAYNVHQSEVNFAVSKDFVDHRHEPERNLYPEKGLVEYDDEVDNSLDNIRGQDNFYSSTELPAYAHSYLLTGVLSPDYSDITGNGITDDDYGSAVKFNYYKVPGHYQWRTPYEENMANLDQGFITSKSDDKGSYVYGKKEIWYLQSMESKTHIAEFKLSPRKDGYGVIDENGGKSTSESNTLLKLDSIVIYSKIDLLSNGSKAVPVKTIVFKYDYSLCKGIPNSENSTYGKLTLKSIYFTYQNSGKGVLNPYKFTYSDFNPNYSHVHYDRWGNYKRADEKLPNRDYPYLDYDTDRDTLDKYATAWNLTQVELPSGGKINVQYEADDYAYVQDRKAMQMVKIIGAAYQPSLDYWQFKVGDYTKKIRKPNQAVAIKDNLYDNGKNNNYLFFKLREDPGDITGNTHDYLLNHYLRNEHGDLIDYIYYRFKVNIDPAAHGFDDFEYISGYAQIDVDQCGIDAEKKYGYIKLKEVNQGDVGITKCNPIAKQAWQTGMQYLRKVMYPGSDLSQGGDKGDAIKSLMNSFGQALNIFTGPYQNLRMKKIAQHFEVNKSYIRLFSTDQFKPGGGCRVKKITINDNWSNMDSQQESGQYGQEFSYITKTKLSSNKGEVISSGVASYEPFIGGDENPFRIPAFYHTNRFMFPDLNEYLEEPFGETFFPSASVGYSRVVVRNIPKPGAIVTSTGKVVHEFFTARDFPVITTYTPMKYLKNGGGSSADDDKPGRKRGKKFIKALTSLFNVVKRDYMVASQGYSIILNDMHGKPKSTAIYSSDEEGSDPVEKQFNGLLISGTEYKYKTSASTNRDSFNHIFNLASTEKFKPVPVGARLNNTVWVMKENGILEQKEIGSSYDIAVDTRESKSHFEHAGLDFNLENFLIMTVPCPYPKYSVTQDLFQSAVVTKVIQQYGILEETVAYDHSSTVSTKNLVWDEQTGQVLLTATTNEFNDPIYNFTYPAHLAYDRMGPAYKNMDFEEEITLGSGGNVDTLSLSTASYNMFVEGDELLMKKDGNYIRGWVLKAEKYTSGKYKKLRIIDITGAAVSSGAWHVRVIRSGRRNLSAVPVGAITTMNKDIYQRVSHDSTKRLKLTSRIVQSSAAVFTDEWQGYLNKAIQLNQVCDTFKLGVQEMFSLLQSIVATGNSDEYVYNGSNWPPPVNTLGNYTGVLRESIERYARQEASEVLNYCPQMEKTVDTIFFGSLYSDPSSFFFKAKYHCGSGNTQYPLDIVCEIGVNPTIPGCMTFNELESIGPLYNIMTSTAKFKGYKDDDSCEFTISFSNQCFFDTDCYYVPNCDYDAGRNINPFVNNIRGVWRQKEAFAYNSDRTYKAKKNYNTSIREDGMITGYQPFWKFKTDYTNGLERNTANAGKWVSTGSATLYAPEGNGLEEQDALGIYSSQLFGYNNMLVTAQAGNARHCQIGFDNFEDYYTPLAWCGRQDHFDFRDGLSLGQEERWVEDNANRLVKVYLPIPPVFSTDARIAKDTAHTGFYSMCVKPAKSHSNVRTIDYGSMAFYAGDTNLFRISSMDKLITPFAPTAGKYVISGWVYEKHADRHAANTYEDAYLNVKVYNGGSAVVDEDFYAAGMIIESWQRIDGTFTIPAGADSIKVTLVNSGSVLAYFDDIRVHPFDSKMAGHVYDPVLLKVMAELDDNNYATFYEYDDEGSLVRVKRETEKGIMTIQESRKSIRKTTP